MDEKSTVFIIGGQDMTEFIHEYEKHGIKSVWIVDPIERIVSIYILNKFGKYGKPGIYESDNKTLQAVFSNFEVSLVNRFTNKVIFDSDLFESAIEHRAEQRNLEIAKALINNGVSIDVIANSTGLSETEILSLKSE